MTKVHRKLVRHNMNRKNNDCGRISCKCQKSKCLKLYCNCFQQNLLCTYSCQCHDCENTETYSGPGGARTMAVEEVINRRPGAFSPRSSEGGCSCKKNKCLKKYCVSLNFFCYFGIRLLCISQLVLLLHSQICFNQSLKCDDKCRCKDCQNQATSKEEDLHIKVEPIPNDEKCIQERGTNAAPYKSWDKRLEQLRQHFETHGDFECQMDIPLWRWISDQRCLFRQIVLEGKQNKLSVRRIELLNSIGFEWNVDEKVEDTDDTSCGDNGTCCVSQCHNSTRLMSYQTFIQFRQDGRNVAADLGSWLD